MSVFLPVLDNKLEQKSGEENEEEETGEVEEQKEQEQEEEEEQAEHRTQNDVSSPEKVHTIACKTFAFMITKFE